MRNQDYKPYFMTNEEWYVESGNRTPKYLLPKDEQEGYEEYKVELTEKGKALKRVVQSYNKWLRESEPDGDGTQACA